jgi:hypothetical protein
MRKLVPVGLSFLAVLAAGGLAYALRARYSRPVPFSQAGFLIGVILGPLFAPKYARWQNDSGEEVGREESELYLEGKMKRYSLLLSQTR